MFNLEKESGSFAREWIYSKEERAETDLGYWRRRGVAADHKAAASKIIVRSMKIGLKNLGVSVLDRFKAFPFSIKKQSCGIMNPNI